MADGHTNTRKLAKETPLGNFEVFTSTSKTDAEQTLDEKNPPKLFLSLRSWMF